MPENKKFWKFCNQAGNKVELLLYHNKTKSDKANRRSGTGKT